MVCQQRFGRGYGVISGRGYGESEFNTMNEWMNQSIAKVGIELLGQLKDTYILLFSWFHQFHQINQLNEYQSLHQLCWLHRFHKLH